MKNKLIIIGLILNSIITSTAYAAGDITVYSSRNASYLKPLFDEYSRETNVSVSYLVAPASALLSRLEVEGTKSKADLLFTTGVKNLIMAESKGLLSSVDSRTLIRNVPEQYRSQRNQWFGLSKRARTIVYNPEKVDEGALSSYTDLANPKWERRLCLSLLTSDYNQSLVAFLLKHSDDKTTLSHIKGWEKNLATNQLGDDIQVMEAIDKGQCDLGITNSYYFVRYKRIHPDTNLKLLWANQNTTGVYVDVTGAAITANAPNRKQAIDLLEWLTTKQIQVKYSRLSMEYPTHENVFPPREVAKWGRFKEGKLNLSQERLAKAGMLIHTLLPR